MLDISDTGARLIVKQELDVKSEVQVSINGYGMKGSIKRAGTVRWLVKIENGQFCVGVEFQKNLSYRDWLSLIAPS